MEKFMNTFLKSTLVSAFALMAAAPALAGAGFIALEGSDSTALHMDPVYTPQLFKYLQGGSAKNVLVFNPSGVINLSAITGGVGVTNVTSLTGLTLSDYSAIYIEAPGGCCTANNTVLNGFGAAVNTFISGGGNLSIENYVGGGYDGVVPGGAAAPAGVIQQGCTDTEVLTAFGASKGFAQPPIDGCWEHQGYQNSYWKPLGYQSLIDSTAYTFADGTTSGSALLALGGTLAAAVPEPASWALMLTGFGLAGVAMRRRRSTKVQFA